METKSRLLLQSAAFFVIGAFLGFWTAVSWLSGDEERAYSAIELHKEISSFEEYTIGTVVACLDKPTVVPGGWHICDGRPMSQRENEGLFQKIGYTFGKDGHKFRLPDYRGMGVFALEDVVYANVAVSEAKGKEETLPQRTKITWMIKVR